MSPRDPGVARRGEQPARKRPRHNCRSRALPLAQGEVPQPGPPPLRPRQATPGLVDGDQGVEEERLGPPPGAAAELVVQGEVRLEPQQQHDDAQMMRDKPME